MTTASSVYAADERPHSLPGVGPVLLLVDAAACQEACQEWCQDDCYVLRWVRSFGTCSFAVTFLASPPPPLCPAACVCCILQVVKKLAKNGVKMIAMRCAGFDRVDLAACAEHGIKVARVPTYSPTSVAEHAVSLLMALNRWVAAPPEGGDWWA